ncbi:MAG TPA: type II toxin-antitoxin system Phd/YefM family antitoxin [Verrucomicrobiae bacterium]|nr:type II toxin-antitoxin system Phd/YefM family antitoxin [Verrucomicrobiae bacterium]
MKTASVREVRHDLNRILERVANGEEVLITRRRQTVARLLPFNRKKNIRGRMPDISSRLKKVFGHKIISDKTMKDILAENRGNW